MDLLATVSDLEAYIQSPTPLDYDDPQATFYLRWASSIVRGYLRADLDLVSDDVVVLDPIGVGTAAALPAAPVVSVSLVEVLLDGVWTDVTTSVTVSKAKGLITARPGTGIRWPCEDESWRVTYTHGVSPIPDPVAAVTAQVAGEAYANAAGIDQLQTGLERVTYSAAQSVLTDAQKAALTAWRDAVIA